MKNKEPLLQAAGGGEARVERAAEDWEASRAQAAQPGKLLPRVGEEAGQVPWAPRAATRLIAGVQRTRVAKPRSLERSSWTESSQGGAT